ncbi:MAG TPA: ABC transporter substrate-binding protein [Thermoplasmata archaeon]|nr:ABC transporter substrate-binding protein [Thermoplasmata archaeon]
MNSTPAVPPRSNQVSVALFAVVVLVVAGAAVAATAAYFELRGTATSGGPNSVAVTDDLGRAVSVPRDPARVAVLSPSIVDSMARLGLRSHIVGVDCASPSFGGLGADYDANQTAAWNLTSAMCVQVIPFNSEQLLNVSPQLVLASTIISQSAVEEIGATLHIPVVILQPVTVSAILTDVQTLMSIFPTGTLGTALVASLTAELGKVAGFDAGLSLNDSSLATVLLTYAVNPEGSTNPGYWTFGPGTFGWSMVELAGGASATANVTVPWPEVSGPQVLIANPQLVVYGTGFGLALPQYAQGPDWSSLTAVQSGHAYGIDSTLITEPGPSMILTGLPSLIHLLYPTASP